MKHQKKVIVAKILGASGLKGGVKIQSFTEDNQSLKSLKNFTTSSMGNLQLTQLHSSGKNLVAHFLQIADREVAESFAKQSLFVERSQLFNEEEESFFYVDLIGMKVQNDASKILGKVVAVQNFGAGDILEIKPQTNPSFFVSFTKENVPHVDLAQATITVNLPNEALEK